MISEEPGAMPEVLAPHPSARASIAHACCAARPGLGRPCLILAMRTGFPCNCGQRHCRADYLASALPKRTIDLNHQTASAYYLAVGRLMLAGLACPEECYLIMQTENLCNILDDYSFIQG